MPLQKKEQNKTKQKEHLIAGSTVIFLGRLKSQQM